MADPPLACSLAVLRSAELLSPIGNSGPASFAAARAGVSALSATEQFPRRLGGTPIKHCAIDGFGGPGGGIQRLIDPFTALAMHIARRFPCPDRFPVLLCLPWPRPGLDVPAIDDIAQRLLSQLSGLSDPRHSGCFLGGAEAGFSALAYAAHLFAQGDASRCLIGGLDSLLCIDYLWWLEALGRLPTSEIPSGLFPGEAGGWLLLEHRDAALAGDVLLAGLGEAAESAPWYEGLRPSGDGLATALRMACANHPDARVSRVCADLNGEDWRSAEWTNAYLRCAPLVAEPLSLVHPADCWGHLGAATGPALIGYAAWELKRWSPADRYTLVTACADVSAVRSACTLISTAEGSRDPWSLR
jgi:3-oxoacyl-[acyl-carrier-protein] synthase-1